MGRELRRVPLDFNWPLEKVWDGFLNPFSDQATQCPQCEGTGYSPVARLLKDCWYGRAPFKPTDRGSRYFLPTDEAVLSRAKRNIRGRSRKIDIEREAERLCEIYNDRWEHHLNSDDVAALLAADRLCDLTRDKPAGYKPTPEEVNRWSILTMGHDCTNCCIVIGAECKRLGHPEGCDHCGGEGTLWPSEKIKSQWEQWEETPPPTGDGYQLWETISEGSPISPVFAEPEALAEWLATSPDYPGRRNDAGTTKEQWLRFIHGPGWAPSGVLISGGPGKPATFLTGVQAASTP